MVVKRAKGIGRGLVKTADHLINLVVLTIILLLVAFAFYAIWDSNQIFQAADAKQYELYKPSTEDSLSLAELQAINPEVFSWLTVYGTQIDYPVTQGKNNAKYVNTNAFGEYSLSGSIFLDYANDKSFQDFNSILYGHHMEKQTMFGELGYFSEQSYFESHRYGNLFFDGKDHGLEFFAFLQTDAYDTATFSPGIQGKDVQQRYLERLLEKALHTRDIGVTIEDHIILMITCSSDVTNGRSILVARISDERFIDIFGETLTNAQESDSVDKHSGFWAEIPLWIYLIPAILLLIFLLIVIHDRYEKRKNQ